MAKRRTDEPPVCNARRRRSAGAQDSSRASRLLVSIPRFNSLKACAPLLLAVCLFAATPLHAQGNLGALTEISFAQLSDRTRTRLGEAALSINSAAWKHAETANFIYHFFHSFIATPVSVEAEFYYRIIAKELEKDTSQWERKSHIYIFENPADWTVFQNESALDPWTGGIHAGGELFIHRNPEYKWKGSTLGHEVAHLVVHRFHGAGLPLWLNEGYAEYAASRGYASFLRARNYSAKPRVQAVAPDDYLPLAQLTNLTTYPTEEKRVAAFYTESERLVRFLARANAKGFLAFFDGMGKGNRLETALNHAFKGRFASLDVLEREFKPYALKDHGTTLQDQ